MTDEYPAERVAVVVERLAALLASGGAPSHAWGRLATMPGDDTTDAGGPVSRWWRRRTPPAASEVAEFAERIAAGEAPAEVLREQDAASWRALGALWQLTERTGAPFRGSLRELAAGFHDLGQSEREVAVALAGPTSTARIVMLLPLVGIVLGLALGFDTFGVLFGQPLGWVLLAVGASLMLAANAWNRSLVRRAARRPQTPGFALDLVATGMHSGGAAGEVVRETAATLREFSLAESGIGRAGPVVALAVDAGVPAAGLLRSEAGLERRRARTAAATAAANLGTALMLPLGVCILPAFLAVGVVPLLIAVLQQALA